MWFAFTSRRCPAVGADHRVGPLCCDFGGLRAFMGGCGGAPGAAKSGFCVETVTGAVVDHVLFRDLILKIGCCGCPSLRGVTAA